MEIPYICFSLVGGFNLSEKYEFVSWDDDIPNIWKVIEVMFQNILIGRIIPYMENKNHVPNHQSVIDYQLIRHYHMLLSLVTNQYTVYIYICIYIYMGLSENRVYSQL